MIYIFVFLSLIAIIQYLLNSIPKLGVSKLGLASAEVIFSDRKSDSILNRHLDELIYFFCETKFNVLIFEDLDRLNNIDIFIKLRELNTLLNNSDEIIDRNLKITFIYALGDDVFKSMDRAKFFDFIIPIIPVVTTTNAGEVLRLRLSKVTTKEIPIGYFDEITLFIDDMRLLLNISNEFVIYRSKQSQVSGIKLDELKLLSVVVYKNKFPQDFQRLSIRKGVVATIFQNKKNFEKSIIQSLKRDIEELRSEMEAIESENLTSIAELRSVYILEYARRIPSLASVYLNKTYQPLGDLLNDELFHELATLDQVSAVVAGNSAARVYPVSFRSVEEYVNPEFTYQERWESVRKKMDGRLNKIQIDIDSKSQAIIEIKSQTLSDLINKYPSFDFYKINEEEDRKIDLGLIKYLVSNGYIDESYESYTSFFYEGSLSRSDKQFLMNVSQNEPTEIDFKLGNPAIIVEKLESQERLNSPNILNLDLFEYLTKERIKHNQLVQVLLVLIDMETWADEFIYQYMILRTQIDVVVKEITSIKPTYWQELFSRETNENKQTELIIKFLSNISLDSLAEANKENYFTQFLSTDSRAFEMLNELDSELRPKIIETLGLKFSNLQLCIDVVLRGFIYNSNAYVINERNIILIISTLAKRRDSTASYTHIIHSSLERLIEYIRANLNEYINNVWMILPNKESEKLDSITDLLNDKSLERETVEKLITSLPNKIEDLSSIKSELIKTILVSSNKIAANWKNVFDYFTVHENQLNDVLIAFLNSPENYSKVSSKKIPTQLKGADILSLEILQCDELHLDAYTSLIKSMRSKYDDLSGLEISKDKLEALLEAKKIALTKENFQFLNESGEMRHRAYVLIEQNYSKYLKSSSSFNLDLYDKQMLIGSKIIKVQDQFTLLKTIDLTSLEDEKDFVNYVTQWYLDKARDLRLSTRLVSVMLKTAGALTSKIVLFNMYSDELTQDSLLNFIKSHEKLNKLISRRHVTLVNNVENMQFSNALKKNNLVSIKVEDEIIRLIPKSTLYLL